jgi:hypothetical protein
MEASEPADRVVFATVPRVRWQSPDWTNFYAEYSPPGGRSDATLFLGQRTSPSGNIRLVAVDGIVDAFGRPVDGGHDITYMIYAHGRLFAPGRGTSDPVQLVRIGFPESSAGFSYKGSATIWAGQPDPSNRAHFTIRANVDGIERVIDGWLRDDDTLLLETRPTSPPPASQPIP